MRLLLPAENSAPGSTGSCPRRGKAPGLAFRARDGHRPQRRQDRASRGLNLSRAWCWRSLARLPAEDPRGSAIERSAEPPQSRPSAHRGRLYGRALARYVRGAGAGVRLTASDPPRRYPGRFGGWFHCGRSGACNSVTSALLSRASGSCKPCPRFALAISAGIVVRLGSPMRSPPPLPHPVRQSRRAGSCRRS